MPIRTGKSRVLKRRIQKRRRIVCSQVPIYLDPNMPPGLHAGWAEIRRNQRIMLLRLEESRQSGGKGWRLRGSHTCKFRASLRLVLPNGIAEPAVATANNQSKRDCAKGKLLARRVDFSQMEYPRDRYRPRLRESNKCPLHWARIPFGAKRGVLDSASSTP